MSTTRTKRKKSTTPQRRAGPSVSDVAYYLGTLVIAAFAYLIWYVLAPEMWREGIVGLAAAIVILVHLYALQAFLGGAVGGWKGAMARASLRWAGFHRGTDGRPLEDAKGRSKVRNTIIATTVVGLLIVVALAWWLLPELRGG